MLTKKNYFRTKHINLHFKIKILNRMHNQITISPIFREQFLEIYNKPFTADTFEYVYLKITNRNRAFTCTLHKGTEISKLYLFSNYRIETSYKLLKK